MWNDFSSSLASTIWEHCTDLTWGDWCCSLPYLGVSAPGDIPTLKLVLLITSLDLWHLLGQMFQQNGIFSKDECFSECLFILKHWVQQLFPGASDCNQDLYETNMQGSYQGCVPMRCHHSSQPSPELMQCMVFPRIAPAYRCGENTAPGLQEPGVCIPTPLMSC